MTYFLLFFLIFSSQTKATLPEMATKQSASNLRFVSKEGEYTYYQRTNGFLNFSSNYQVATIIKGTKGSQFNIFSTHERKKIIITHDKTYHTHLALQKEVDIYSSNFGSKEVQLVAKGTSPKLHIQDSWLSYYSNKKKLIQFKNLEMPGVSFNISISKDSLPYFIPEVLYINKDEIIYTDQKKNGQTGIIYLNKKSKQSELLLKTEGPFENIELCFNSFKNEIFIGRFSPIGSEIFKVAATHLKKINSIYSSQEFDLGHIDCSDNEQIFFLKTKSNQKDLYSLNLSDAKLKRLSFIKDVSNFINMDGKLIIPFRGKFFLVRGKNNIPYVDQLDSKDREME